MRARLRAAVLAQMGEKSCEGSGFREDGIPETSGEHAILSTLLAEVLGSGCMNVEDTARTILGTVCSKLGFEMTSNSNPSCLKCHP